MKNSTKSKESRSYGDKISQLDFGRGLQDEGNKAAFMRLTIADLSKALSKESDLDKMIGATRISAQAQIRSSYRTKLVRPETVTAALPESRLERGLWLLWGLHKACDENPEFVEDCPHIVSYQVPLYRRRPKTDRDGWGKIDAIGIAKNLTPVVIELKAARSSECLLRMVLEAVAYAIAIQVAWKPQFLQDWKSALKELAGEDNRLINHKSLDSLPDDLNTCRILCAAPSEFWNTHGDESNREDFKEILRHLIKKGFPVSFAKLDFRGTLFEP